MAADENYVYFADWKDDKIKRLAVNGGTPSVLATGNGLIYHRGLVLDASYLYWGDETGIHRILKTGGSVQDLAADTESYSLAVDSTHVYWTREDWTTGQVRRALIGGGGMTTLITNLDSPSGLALDSTQLYFTEAGTGKAYHANKDGSGLASYYTASISPYMAGSIAVDNTNAYWVDTTSLHDGRLHRVAKGGGTINDLALGLFGPGGVHVTATHVYWGDYYGIYRLLTNASPVNVDLSITNVEITQGVQCLDTSQGATACADNSVPLIADRPTTLRVYPAVTISSVANVTAQLVGTKGGSPLPGSPIQPVKPKQYVSLDGAQRANANDTINFELPASWRSGTITLQAEINPGNIIPELNTANNKSQSLTVTFKTAKTLNVAYVPVRYTAAGWTGAQLPNNTTIANAVNFLRAVLPYSNVNYTAWSSSTLSKSFALGGGDTLLADLNTRYQASTSPPDQLFGWAPAGSWNNGLSDPKFSGGSSVVAAGDENLSPVVIAHEIGHNLGRRHPTCSDGSSDWPYGNTAVNIQEIGFDVYTRTTWPATTVEWMVGGHCSNTSTTMWASPWNWTQVMNGVTDYQPQPVELPAELAPAGQPTAVLTAIITQAGADLLPVLLLSETLTPTPLPSGSMYCFKFLNSTGGQLSQACFDANPISQGFNTNETSAVVSYRQTLPMGTARVRMVKGVQTLDEQRASANAPTVTVVSPNGGENWTGKHTVQWTAQDLDGDLLTYAVLYSRDAGANWIALASGLTTTSLEVDSVELAGSNTALVRVLASDGLLTGEDQSNAVFTVARRSPRVQIQSPVSRRAFVPGELISLRGTADDLEDGGLVGDKLLWSVTGQGQVGYGPEASLRLENPGNYTITLTATDSDQMQGSAQVDITVGANLYLEPPLRQIQVGQNTTLDLMVDGVRNLYGFQIELAFNPALVEVVDAKPGVPGVQIEDGDFFIPDIQVKNIANNTTGVIEYAASLQKVKPGVSGGGRLARITFKAKAPGVSPVSFTRAILSDPFSAAIPTGRGEAQIVIQQVAGSVAGKVILERRASSAGAQVCLNTNCALTNASGNYTFPLLPVGVITATVTHLGYLPAWYTFNLQAAPQSLPDVTLLGGDIRPDGHIELADAELAGQAWNANPTTPNWIEAADITADNQVNVLDMVAVQYNWDRYAPSPWISGQEPEPMALALQSPLPSDSSQPEATAQVQVSPASSTIPNMGASVDVDILVQNVANLYAYRLQISFDPSVVRVKDADPSGGSPGVQIQAGEFLDVFNLYVIYNQANNSTGMIDFAVTQTYPATAKSGSGQLARITFEGLKPGSSVVDIFQARLLDNSLPDPLEIPVAISDGNIQVGGGFMLYLPLLRR
jgi:hypothetical protein